MRAGFVVLMAIAGCHFEVFKHGNSVYFERANGYSVELNWRHSRAGTVFPVQFGDVGEPGALNAGVIEFVFAAADSPIARYYDLMLSLPHLPRVVDADLAALRSEMSSAASPRSLTGRDYARALGRKLATPINVALGGTGNRVHLRAREWLLGALNGGLFRAGNRVTGTAGVLWGIPVDLDAGIPLVDYEQHEGIRTMQTTLLRYESVALLFMHSSATQDVLVWDLSDLPGAFQTSPVLDQATVAAHIVALHRSDR